MTRASKARAHLHGSRYIYMPSIVTSVLEFSTRHDAVLLFDIFKMGIGYGSGHLNALIYHILKLFCLLRYSIKTLKSKKWYCKKRQIFLSYPYCLLLLKLSKVYFFYAILQREGNRGILCIGSDENSVTKVVLFGIYSRMGFTSFSVEYLKGGE